MFKYLFFLALSTTALGQVDKSGPINRALNKKQCIKVNVSGTLTDGLCVENTAAVSLPLGIVGSDGTADAATGRVGQVIRSYVASGSAVSLTTGNPSSITSISLTAGDWIISGGVGLTGGATTDIDLLLWGINTSASLSGLDYTAGSTLTTIGYRNVEVFPSGSYTPLGTFGTLSQWPLTTVRVRTASTQTVHLVAQADFSVSTLSAFGYIYATRIR